MHYIDAVKKEMMDYAVACHDKAQLHNRVVLDYDDIPDGERTQKQYDTMVDAWGELLAAKGQMKAASDLLNLVREIEEKMNNRGGGDPERENPQYIEKEYETGEDELC